MTGKAVAAPMVIEPADERRTPGSVPLPHATVDAFSGLAEIMAQLGPMSVADLADELGLEVDDLLPLVDALELLGFAHVEAGQIRLTPEGLTFAGADIQASKQNFATAALERAPLVRVIVNGLERAGDHTLMTGFFTQILRRSFSDDEAHRQLDMAIDWGRYGELYSYDADHDELALDPARVPTELGPS
jgi:NitT/TauT family transport system ATP-binding protein